MVFGQEHHGEQFPGFGPGACRRSWEGSVKGNDSDISQVCYPRYIRPTDGARLRYRLAFC